MTSCKQIEVQFQDENPRKWCHPLKEDGFAAFMSKENPSIQKIFGSGSFFSPLLFGKFFDPSDAFPLWEFDSDTLLTTNLHSSSPRRVDWFQTDTDYVLKAELPAGISSSPENSIQICIEDGKILEISGQWRQQRELRTTKDWKSSCWWEHGYVRRLELPEQMDWRKSEAQVKNDVLLEIRIPKTSTDLSPQGN